MYGKYLNQIGCNIRHGKVERRKARLPSFLEIIAVFRDVALTGQWSSPSGCSMGFEFDGMIGVLRGNKV